MRIPGKRYPNTYAYLAWRHDTPQGRSLAGNVVPRDVKHIIWLSDNAFNSSLRVNRTIYHDLCHAVYQGGVIDFHTDIEAMVPFFKDRLCTTLRYIRRISFTFIAFCIDPVDGIDAENIKLTSFVNPLAVKDALEFVDQNLRLGEIELTVVCSESFLPELDSPGRLYFSKEDIHTRVSQVEGLEWINELRKIDNVKTLKVTKLLSRRRLPPLSPLATFCAQFSETVERGLREYLEEAMVTRS